MKVGVIGATGYAGQQLIGLLSRHPKVKIEFLSSYSYEGEVYSDVYGVYKSIIDKKCIGLYEALDSLDDIDVLFIALPHGKSLEIIQNIKNKKLKIIDFGADFRLSDIEVIYDWYDLKHTDKALLESAVYGLPEVNRKKIKETSLVANPGCYPTASILGLLPIIKEDYIDQTSIIIDAKSGVTGAGRKETLATSYCESNENMKAYSVAAHRHTPEIEDVLSQYSGSQIVVNFTPHLVPMQRGILATIYISLTKAVDVKEIVTLYKQYYCKDQFVRIIEGLPETKHVCRTNYCDIGITYDRRSNRLIIVSAIDNLVKGSAGVAVQNMNIMMGESESLGLETGFYYL